MNILSTLENIVEAASLFFSVFINGGRGIHIDRLRMLRMILKAEGADFPEKFTYDLTHRVNTLSYAEYSVPKQLQDIFYSIKR